MVATRSSGLARYGIIVNSMPAAVLNSSADKFCVLPTLMVPTLRAPGFALAAATKSGKVLNSEIAIGCEHEIEKTQTGNRLKIFHRIVGKVFEQRRADGSSVREQCEGMTVARRAGNGASRGYAAGPRLIFYVKSATKLRSKFLCNNAGRDVGDPACRKGQHDPHCLVRVFGLRFAHPLRKSQADREQQGHPQRREISRKLRAGD